MQFLNPIWLYGISGIAIPILIHLWNIKTGKTLKVGSIILMKESSRQNSRSMKLQDILSLLLRCLFIIILSFILAEPVWKSNTVAREKGWILIPSEDIHQAYEIYQKKIDSLLNLDYEFHYFEPDFKKADLPDALKDDPVKEDQNDLSYWSILKQLEEEPALKGAYIFTNRRLSNFMGSRPEVRQPVQWTTFTGEEEEKEWISDAWKSGPDSIHVSISTSGKEIVEQRIEVISATADRFHLTADAGKPMISFRRKELYLDTSAVKIDTATLRIGIYEKDHPADARYVRSAAQAISRFTGRKIVLHSISEQEMQTDLNFIFWLSEKTIPQMILRKLPKGARIFNYAAGKISTGNSWLVANDQYLHHGSRMAVLNRVADIANSGIPVWTDGFGKPLLTKYISGNFTSYLFYGRFNPAWNDMAWNSEFPRLIHSLILPNKDLQIPPQLDLREIDPVVINQLVIKNDDPAEVKGEAAPVKSLINLLSILLILILLLERCLATSKLNKQI